jgi:hypothetical protein
MLLLLLHLDHTQPATVVGVIIISSPSAAHERWPSWRTLSTAVVIRLIEDGDIGGLRLAVFLANDPSPEVAHPILLCCEPPSESLYGSTHNTLGWELLDYPVPLARSSIR